VREEIETPEWTVRQKYNYGPADPRFLRLTKLDVAMECWRLHAAAAQGEPDYYETEEFDDVMTRMDQGEPLDAILREFQALQDAVRPDAPADTTPSEDAAAAGITDALLDALNDDNDAPLAAPPPPGFPAPMAMPAGSDEAADGR
jgi:hypothetical protein